MCTGGAAAEIKHGRVSMLAVVGFLLTQYVHLPGDQFQEGPLEALTTVPIGAQFQVFCCEYELLYIRRAREERFRKTTDGDIS